VCCYPEASGFVEAYAEAIRRTAAGSPGPLRLLFSAHGLPEKIVRGGDPYQAQVEATAAAVLAVLAPAWSPQWEICYQSRVGPLKWIGPATDDCVLRAGADGQGVLLAPIAFVSEHVETLVELDHEYKALADAAGVPVYLRAPTVSVAETFISGLAETVAASLERPASVETACGGRWCPAPWSRCPARAA
jgi:ferrochelatase